MTCRILIVEDNEYFRRRIIRLLNSYGHIEEAKNFTDADHQIRISEQKKIPYDVAIIDINLGENKTGLELLNRTKNLGAYNIVLTDYDEDQYIEKAYAFGADHYLTKDDCESVIPLLIEGQVISQKKENDFSKIFAYNFITNDEHLKAEIISLKSRLIKNRPVLILGETGVGKSELAKIIHSFSRKKNGPFIGVNIANIPENLAESELFGHCKGSFTGAIDNLKGKLESAHQGTIFLDEIGTASLDIQKKLLKAIEEKEFYPIGRNTPIKSDFQLISATHEDIFKKIKDEMFRIDFYYRINAITIDIPPLRDRRGDIPLLIKHFIQNGPSRIYIENKAMEKLKDYDWPGNIRELKSVVDELLFSHNGIIKVEGLPTYIIKNEFQDKKLKRNTPFISVEQMAYLQHNGFKKFIKKMEIEIVNQCLDLNDKKVIKAAEFSGISIPYFYKLMQMAKLNNLTE